MRDPKLEIQMLHDRVMVKADASGERRSGAGIVIPATAEVARRLVWGEVFGVGNYVRTVKVGDRCAVRADEQFESRCRARPTCPARTRTAQPSRPERTEHGTGLYL
jgi:chaperonin GroES